MCFGLRQCKGAGKDSRKNGPVQNVVRSGIQQGLKGIVQREVRRNWIKSFGCGVYVIKRNEVMTTYLINALHEQRIATEEFGTIKVLVYSNPAYYEKKILSRDFGEIVAGDDVILCKDSKLRFLANVEEVLMATDASDDERYRGKPVKLLKGKLVGRLGNVSVGAASSKMVDQGVNPPNLINKAITGFKQGAFAEKLTDEQASYYKAWLE
jgi:hypothetical protein